MSSQSMHQKWKKHLKDYQKSNLSVTQFCRERGFTTSRFYYWRKIFQEQATNTTEDSLFIPINESKKNQDISITLANGIKLKFSSVPDSSWLAQLITDIGSLDARLQEIQ